MAYFGFTNKLINGETIKIFNYGNCKRDFTYVDDIVEGIIRIMQGAPEQKQGEDGLPIPPYNVYNIGNSNPENLLDFVKILQEELVRAGVLPEDYDFESHKELVPMQPGDVPVTYADTSALERDYSDELDEYYEWADIGLGDLGRHRVGALSGSCLKTKEYFGKGLPFITSLVEPTYTSDYKYVLQLEANDNPIDFNKIEKFYNIVYSDADRVDNMVSFAKENFTWDKQLLPVVKEIEKRISLKSNESEK